MGFFCCGPVINFLLHCYRRKPGFTEKSHIFQHFYTKMEYIYNSLSVESAKNVARRMEDDRGESSDKKYGSHYAVNDLSFQVEKGQIYGFLGPNGAGKSTTMNIITGYLAPTAGEVKVDGHDIMKEPEEAKRCIGYLPEMPPVYPDMTVQEYLRFAAELKGIPSKNGKTVWKKP